ncbi:MAG: molybdate ABC transporter substrate-binding protein [Bosea sp. (in: a-proteobacteria)]
MRVSRRLMLTFAAALPLLATPALAQPTELVIFAAASLKNALDEAASVWTRETGKPAPRISYAASGSLARQIEQGAPADLFLSADLDWMDYLDGRGLIRKETRLSLLGNAIVLIAPKDSTASVDLSQAAALSAALGSGRLAMANVEAVPAGKYGKAALEKLGGWDKVKDRVAQAENVRAALLLVARGEAPLGIVYATDASAEPGVKVLARFPAGSHPPIIYPAAVVKSSNNADALPFLRLLSSAKARSAFTAQGFTMLVEPANAS